MAARRVIKLDGLFEAVLGLALVVGGLSDALGGEDFPHPVGRALLLVAGCALLAVAVVLWRGAVPLVALAGANLVTAVAAVVWIVAADGFSSAGKAIVIVTAVALVCLGVSQLAARVSNA